jgi:hypothetical protein
MCNAKRLGSIDQIRNTFIQRHAGNVHVVIDLEKWWYLMGAQGSNRSDVGVKAFGSAAGAMVFANVNPYITTVLPLGVVSKIMMRHPTSEDFVRRIQRVQDERDAENGRYHNTLMSRAGWINIYSPALALK